LYAAAFHTGNADELGSYADYSLKINAHSEESWLWKGWAMILRNQEEEAAQCFRKALSIKPDYQDALYAVEFLKK
jgi:tetratricopeptide (TPR) repeat protein